MSSWPAGISAITVFAEDLASTKAFYREVFGLAVQYEDDNSAVFNFGNTLVNLLKATEAKELIEPATVAPPDDGVRYQFTITVDDVDATLRGARQTRRRAIERAAGSAVGHPDRGISRSGRSHLGDREVAMATTRRRNGLGG